MPSPMWMRYAAVLPLAKFAHTPSAVAFDGEERCRLHLVGAEAVDWVSMVRASEPKQASAVPGRPTIDVVPAMRPLSSPHLSISHFRLPAPSKFAGHHAGFPCEASSRHCFTSTIAV